MTEQYYKRTKKGKGREKKKAHKRLKELINKLRDNVEKEIW